MSEESLLKTTQFLTFTLEDELFGFDIGKVREVLDFTTITKVPRTPDYMRGVINLRGSVVPVMDLRLKFGKELAEQTVNTCVIIVEVEFDGEKVVMGALADAVQEVLDLNSDQIEAPPRLGAKLKLDFIQGMGKHDDQFIIILDIDKVFAGEEREFLPEEDQLAANG
jgi:purine-binding chemotaxis protein CheW